MERFGWKGVFSDVVSGLAAEVLRGCAESVDPVLLQLTECDVNGE
jgi:hypothetical protein